METVPQICLILIDLRAKKYPITITMGAALVKQSSWWTTGCFQAFSIINNAAVNIFEYISWSISMSTAVKMFRGAELPDPSLGAFWILTWQQSLTCPLPLDCSPYYFKASSHTEPVTSLANWNTCSASPVPATQGPVPQPGPKDPYKLAPSSPASSLMHTSSLPHTSTSCQSPLSSACRFLCLDCHSQPLLPGSFCSPLVSLCEAVPTPCTGLPQELEYND